MCVVASMNHFDPHYPLSGELCSVRFSCRCRCLVSCSGSCKMAFVIDSEQLTLWQTAQACFRSVARHRAVMDSVLETLLEKMAQPMAGLVVAVWQNEYLAVRAADSTTPQEQCVGCDVTLFLSIKRKDNAAATSSPELDSERIQAAFQQHTTLRSLVWCAFQHGIERFAEALQHQLELGTFDDGHLVSYDPREMRCSILVAGSRVDIKLALPSNAGVRLVLLQEPMPDGSIVVQHFPGLQTTELASLPLEGIWLTCVLKSIFKQEVPLPCPDALFERVVSETFHQHGWVMVGGQSFQLSIPFVVAWRQCWERILNWQPISAPEHENTNLFDTIQDCVKQQLQDLTRRMLAQKEPSVVAIMQRCLTGVHGFRVGRSLSR